MSKTIRSYSGRILEYIPKLVWLTGLIKISHHEIRPGFSTVERRRHFEIFAQLTTPAKNGAVYPQSHGVRYSLPMAVKTGDIRG
jgi:hypothetical protein